MVKRPLPFKGSTPECIKFLKDLHKILYYETAKTP